MRSALTFSAAPAPRVRAARAICCDRGAAESESPHSAETPPPAAAQTEGIAAASTGPKAATVYEAEPCDRFRRGENKGEASSRKTFCGHPGGCLTGREVKIARSEAAGVRRCLPFRLVTSLLSLAAGTNA